MRLNVQRLINAGVLRLEAGEVLEKIRADGKVSYQANVAPLVAELTIDLEHVEALVKRAVRNSTRQARAGAMVVKVRQASK